jgi:hypothetical protein
MGGEAKSDCRLAKRDGGLSYERWAAKPSVAKLREMGGSANKDGGKAKRDGV